MGFLDFFWQRKALSASPGVVEAIRDRRTNFYVALGGTNQQANAAFTRGQSASYGWLYANRPAVRSVVDYIARNVAQLPLKLYERIDDTERERREDHPAAQSLKYPDQRTPQDEFIFRFVADFLVYDNAYLLKFAAEGTKQITFVRLPPAQVTVSGGRFTADFYRVWRSDGSYFDVQPENILHWYGYNPEDPLLGISKLETLRDTLTEDQVSQASTVDLMKNGLKGGHIERPVDAPIWTEEGRQRFQESWANQEKATPRKTPVLEEGMTFRNDVMTSKDAELLASRKFRVEEVCHVYGVPPGVLGLEPSTQLDEQRKQVYSDVLPPITQALACQLDADILRAEYSETDYYFEFDLNAKLQGDAETRFAAITSAAGRPWLTVNEVRAMENKPAIDGGDDLTIPLNVMIEGQGSPALPAPNVMPPQDPNKPPQDGSHREMPKELTNGHKALQVSTRPRREIDMARNRRNVDEAQALLRRFYQRQMDATNTKAFNSARWNKELAADIHAFLEKVFEAEGSVYVARLGGDDFDMRQVKHFLKGMAEGTASGVNRATQRDVAEIGAAAALLRARDERSDIAGASIGTRATVRARQEAAKQAPTPELRQMTWIRDTERHAALDGKSVPLGSTWGGIEPGSEPNCQCTALIS